VKAIAILAMLSGWLWATPTSDVLDGYEARGVIGDNNRGGSVHRTGGIAGVHLDAEAGVRQFRRAEDPNSYTGTSAALSLRVSPFGIIASDHKLERYFDLGAEAGGEASVIFGVPAKLAGAGAGWVGGWVEFGTIPVDTGYLAITGNIRTMSLTDTWQDQLVVAVGLGWRSRRTVTARDLRWND
jgi:hypothetical protein